MDGNSSGMISQPPPVVIILGILVCVYLLFYIRKAREGIRHNLHGGLWALIVAGIAYILADANHFEPKVRYLLAGGAGIIVILLQPKRKRRISKSVRQAVIDRDLRSKNLKWNPKKYHIDHKVPYSKGGSHTVDNLRVVPKEDNLRKGKKMPGFFDILK